MDHNLGIVLIFTIGFALATFFAYITQRLKLSPILGYLLAGFIIGPYSPGYTANYEIAEQLAEIGVILMLFGVGLHFKIEDLIKVKNVAIPGAVIQTTVTALLTMLIVHLAGWPYEMGLIMGLAIGVASTVVLMRMLTDNHMLSTIEGHIAIGWLIVEDIFTVFILILIPTLATFGDTDNFSWINLIGTIGIAIAKFVILALFMFTWGHKFVAYILTNIARLHSHEMFTLAVIALVFLIATGSTVIFGTSIALGAFIAGMVIGKTHVKHQAAANALPLKDIFGIVFFLSVGMIFNPLGISSNYLLFFGLLAVIILVKPLTAYLLTAFLGYPIRTALVVAIGLAQIGEFSFILAEQALKFHLLSDEGYDFLVAGALISISLNPLLFSSIEGIESLLKKVPFLYSLEKKFAKNLSPNNNDEQNSVIIGYGQIGKTAVKILKDNGYESTIIENNIDIVSHKKEDENIIFGEATEENILREAQIDKATYLLITISDSTKTIKIIHTARQINPSIKIIGRAQFTAEEPLMDKLKVQYICTERTAIRDFTALIRHILQKNTLQL